MSWYMRKTRKVSNIRKLLISLIFVTNFNVLQSNSSLNKVKVDVYLETLCPESRSFITKQVKQTYHLLKNFTDISLYFYGNAKRQQISDGKWILACQHGPLECEGNVIQNCVLNLYNNNNLAMEFIFCVMDPKKSFLMMFIDIYKICAEKLQLDYNEIRNCKNGPKGIYLTNIVAAKTESLWPPLHYVPWIVIDNYNSDTQTQEARSNLLKLLCKNPKMIGSTFCQVILLLPTFMFASDPKDSTTTDGYYVWNNQALVQSLRYPSSGFNSDGYQEKMMPFDNPFSSYSQFLPPPRFFPYAMPFMQQQPNPVGFNGYVPEIPDFGQLQNIMPSASQSQTSDNSNNQVSPPPTIPAVEPPNMPPVPQNEPNNEAPQNEKYVKQTITETPAAQQPSQPEDL